MLASQLYTKAVHQTFRPCHMNFLCTIPSQPTTSSVIAYGGIRSQHWTTTRTTVLVMQPVKRLCQVQSCWYGFHTVVRSLYWVTLYLGLPFACNINTIISDNVALAVARSGDTWCDNQLMNYSCDLNTGEDVIRTDIMKWELIPEVKMTNGTFLCFNIWVIESLTYGACATSSCLEIAWFAYCRFNQVNVGSTVFLPLFLRMRLFNNLVRVRYS